MNAFDAKREKSDGRVEANGQERGQIQIVAFEDESQLRKEAGNLFRTQAEPQASTAVIAQGMIEESNVRPVVELTRLVAAMRSYQGAQKLVDEEHRRMRTAIERLTRES